MMLRLALRNGSGIGESRERLVKGLLVLTGVLVAIGIGELGARVLPPKWLSIRMRELRVVGDVFRVKMIGAGMTHGRIIIEGNAGMHLGAAMSGGEILVEGNAADWVGSGMLGGRIVVKGNAGHLVGSALRGESVGNRGGEIIIHGNTGNEIGSGMRRGLVAVGGNSGDFTGVNMLAGTVVVLGRLGIRTGAGMKRGTVASCQPAELLPTFSYACTYRPVALRLVLGYLRGRGLTITKEQFAGRYRRWSGDGIETSRGEILLLEEG